VRDDEPAVVGKRAGSPRPAHAGDPGKADVDRQRRAGEGSCKERPAFVADVAIGLADQEPVARLRATIERSNS
jgi:uncharacterized phage protein gp47/JayE